MFTSNQPLHPRISIQKPNETEEYLFDWSGFLANGETITNSVWKVVKNVIGSDTQLTINHHTIGDTKTYVYLTSNNEYFLEAYYTIYNTITTSLDRTNTEYFAVVIVGRETE